MPRSRIHLRCGVGMRIARTMRLSALTFSFFISPFPISPSSHLDALCQCLQLQSQSLVSSSVLQVASQSHFSISHPYLHGHEQQTSPHQKSHVRSPLCHPISACLTGPLVARHTFSTTLSHRRRAWLGVRRHALYTSARGVYLRRCVLRTACFCGVTAR